MKRTPKKRGEDGRTVQLEMDAHAVLQAAIFSMEKGKERYEDIRMIRLRDKTYSLMLMADHTPMIGELDGSLALLLQDEEITFTDIQGYYSLKKNVFRFLCRTMPRKTEEDT